MSDKTLSCFLCIALMLLPGAVVGAETSVSDLVPQYPRSELESFADNGELATHEIVMGTVKKNAGIVRPEKSEFVVGRRASSTWYVPGEERTDVVARFYRDKLATLGDIVFECKGYDCGSSSYWANTVFGKSILYGPEQYQHYILTRVKSGATYYIATYVALRGTRKLYVHTDVIATEGARPVDSAGIVSTLESRGRYVIDAGSEEGALPGIVAAMQQKPLMRIAIVSHARKQQGESVDQAIARSEGLAKALVKKLVAAGATQTRVSGYGVGPLVPLERDVIDRTEVVLISFD